MTCSPVSGTGSVSTGISDLAPEDSVIVGVTACVIDTSNDSSLDASAAAFESPAQF